MVSGFVTSPYDHERICSGEASEIRTDVKSLTSSMNNLLLCVEQRSSINQKERNYHRLSESSETMIARCPGNGVPVPIRTWEKNPTRIRQACFVSWSFALACRC